MSKRIRLRCFRTDKQGKHTRIKNVLAMYIDILTRDREWMGTITADSEPGYPQITVGDDGFLWEGEMNELIDILKKHEKNKKRRKKP